MDDVTEKILQAIRGNPDITWQELSDLTGKTTRTVARKLNDLKNNGYIKRIGSDKNGFLQVLK